MPERRPAHLYELVHGALDAEGIVTRTGTGGDTRYAHALQAVDGRVYRATVEDDIRLDDSPKVDLAYCHPRADLLTRRGWSKIGAGGHRLALGEMARYIAVFEAARQEFRAGGDGEGDGDA